MSSCTRCQGPTRTYAPWEEPPENHYDECRRCGHIEYAYDPRETTHMPCNCAPDLGPVHCHLCSDELHREIAWTDCPNYEKEGHR